MDALTLEMRALSLHFSSNDYNNSEGVPLLACLFLYTFLAIPEIVLNTLSQEIAHLGVDKKVPQAIRSSEQCVLVLLRKSMR